MLSGLPPQWAVTVVGPADDAGAAGRPMRWVREDPPFGGPAAGLAAACATLDPLREVVVVLAGDLPFATPAVPRLLSALAGTAGTGGTSAETLPDAAVGVDPAGRRQPLLGAYRRAPLAAELARGSRDRSMRDVLARLRVVEVPVTQKEAWDVDTPADLAQAQRWPRGRA